MLAAVVVHSGPKQEIQMSVTVVALQPPVCVAVIAVFVTDKGRSN